MQISAAVHFLTYYLPAVIKAAVFNLLSIAPNSSVFDFKNAVLLGFVRAVSNDPKPGPLLAAQRVGCVEADLKAPAHVLKTVLSLPQHNNIEDVVSKAIKGLADGSETIPAPKAQSVVGEWVVPRNRPASGVQKKEAARYAALMDDTQNDITILYFHGGQFWRRGRSTRSITYQLAKETGGRCFALQYRLAPQNPFPSPLVDGLVAYLSLLYPPPNSLHGPVRPENICFAGDSAGGYMVLALLQLILELRRQSNDGKAKVHWSGKEREIPLPTSISALSPYVDLTRAFDSEDYNLKYDLINPRGPPFATWARDSIWPVYPARHHVYANDNALLHPLVSPVIAPGWKGSPPVWICVGEECLADQGMYVAERLARDNVPVVVKQYSAMPHNFALVFESLFTSQSSRMEWARFIRNSFDDRHAIESEAKRLSGRSLYETVLDVRNLVKKSLEVVKKDMAFQIESWGPPPT